MFGDKLLRRCVIASVLINALFALLLSRYDWAGNVPPRPEPQARRFLVYRPPIVHRARPKPMPKPKPRPGPKLPPPPHPARIRQAVRRVTRPPRHPVLHPSPVKARTPRPHPAKTPTPPTHAPPVATGSHSAQGTVVLPPSVGSVGAPADATTPDAGGGGDVGETATNLSGDGTGLVGEYYRGVDFGSLAFTRADATIDFDWPDSQPDPQMPPRSAYSVRWTGRIEPRYSETYTFSTLSDDGARLWIDGRQVIDDWQHHPATAREGTVTLLQGHKYALRLEYFENGNPPGKIRLWWASASQAKEIVPQSQLFPNDQ